MTDDNEILKRIDGKLDQLNDNMTDVKVHLGKVDAYDIPALSTDVRDNSDRLSRLETRVQTYLAMAGFFGVIVGSLITTFVKNSIKWLS